MTPQANVQYSTHTNKLIHRKNVQSANIGRTVIITNYSAK